MIGLGFWLVILGLHYSLRQLRYQQVFDMDQYWPVSIFLPKKLVWQDGVTLAAVAIAAYWLFFSYKKRAIKMVFLAGTSLILATNLLQGIREGLEYPMAGDGAWDHQYWQDANLIQKPSTFLAEYTTLQPTLLMHSKVHPPGPVLLVYGLRQLVGQAIGVNLLVLLIGVGGIAVWFKLIESWWGKLVALRTSLIYWLLPSVQIYYLASMDAVIATMMILVFWAFVRSKAKEWWLVGGLVYLTAMLTFAAGLLVPTLGLYEWLTWKKLKKTMSALLMVIGLMIMTAKWGGYNYWLSFRLASQFESPGGFYGSKMPLSYLATRLEDGLEILIFLGPLLTWELGAEMRNWWKKRRTVANQVLPAGGLVISLFGFFLTGAYFTGETARAALFVYPFIGLVMAGRIAGGRINQEKVEVIAKWMLAQSVIMQSFGWYNW